MSDPLSVTAIVVGIVGALLHGSKRLYEFIDSLQNAPKDIAALSTDLRALYEILAHITNVQDRLSSNLDFCVNLKAPLQNCLNIFDEFTTLLQGFTQTSRDGTIKVRVWKQMAWAFKDKEIQLFGDTVTAYKVSLDMTLNALTFSTITSLSERTKKFETDFKEEFKDIRSRLQALDSDRIELASLSGCKGSEWYGTEADFALKRFLEYTESLCDSPPASFPGSPAQSPSRDCDGLGTQEWTQGTSSLHQPNDLTGTVSFTRRHFPGTSGSHIDTANSLSPPRPQTYNEMHTDVSKFLSDYKTSYGLHIQNRLRNKQLSRPYQEPISTDPDLKPSNSTRARPGVKTSDPIMNQSTTVYRPSTDDDPFSIAFSEYLNKTAKLQPPTL